MKANIDAIATWVRAHTKTDRGANLVEYGLLVALIALVCIAAVAYFGAETDTRFSSSGSAVN